MAKRKPASTVVHQFITRLQGLEHTRAKMEKLFAASLAGKRDVEHIYGALFVAGFTAFETMLEELFFKLLTSRVRLPRSVQAKATFSSYGAARGVVHGDRKYLDWVPYGRTLDRAERFFYGGRPFTYLTTNEKNRIKEVAIIRNAIAHKGGHARDVFDREITSRLTLAPRERTPTGFLRSFHSTSPNVTRYEQLVSDLSSIAQNLVA